MYVRFPKFTRRYVVVDAAGAVALRNEMDPSRIAVSVLISVGDATVAWYSTSLDGCLNWSADTLLNSGLVGKRSLFTVPVASAVAFRFVMLLPLIALAVPDNCAAGRAVRLAPEPAKVVAVAVPLVVSPVSPVSVPTMELLPVTVIF